MLWVAQRSEDEDRALENSDSDSPWRGREAFERDGFTTLAHYTKCIIVPI